VITISPRPDVTWVRLALPQLLLCPPGSAAGRDSYRWRAELRLGLQEALVNAAKHGNNLDPSKLVIVRFSLANDHYWWVIADQGCGFNPPYNAATLIPPNTCP